MRRIEIVVVTTVGIIMLPMVVFYFMGRPELLESKMIAKLQFSVFVILTVFMVLRNSRYEAKRVMLVGIAAGATALLFAATTLTSRIDFLYTLAWFVILVAAALLDRRGTPSTPDPVPPIHRP